MAHGIVWILVDFPAHVCLCLAGGGVGVGGGVEEGSLCAWEVLAKSLG